MAYQPDVLKCYALALDPIHVGTGGMRLGRVDLSIVREPGTNIPKIPGTSLAGAARLCRYAEKPLPLASKRQNLCLRRARAGRQRQEHYWPLWPA